MTLADAIKTETPDGGAEIRLGDIVAVVREHPARPERVRDHARRLLARGYSREAARAEAERQHDKWQYLLPNGDSFSHPTKAGAVHMARKYFVESGAVLLPFDHCHMGALDVVRAQGLQRARGAHAVPLVGDFVQLADHVAPVARICGFGSSAPVFGLSYGGSFSLPSDPTQTGQAWAGYSGALDWRPEYRTARLVATGRTQYARFWFHSADPANGGAGVDAALACRVWTLDGVES